jgi:hypothetical protein
MPFSRYARAPLLRLGEQYGTSTAITIVRNAVKDGSIKTRETVVRGAERLDTLAGSIFGDSRYWWVLAATSDIGWGLQVPPGTIIRIPDLNDISNLIG